MSDQSNSRATGRARPQAAFRWGICSLFVAASPHRMLLAFWGLLAGLTLLLALTSASAAAGPSQQIPSDPPSASRGRALFQENCAPCHGATGLGDGATAAELPNGATMLADPLIARQATPADWFQITKEGRMDLMMPPWKNRLTDQQIWDVTAYALALHSSDAQLAQGEAVWGQQCAACHGAGGVGDGPQALADGLAMPNLADPAVAAGRSLADWYGVTNAGQGAMPAFAGLLSDEEIWAAATYARSFSFAPDIAAAAPQGAGVLSGQVLNGTTGQPVQALVTLNIFDNFEALQAQEVQSDADGAFSFSDLPTGAQYAFLLSTTYGDTRFGSNIVRFAESQPALDVPLQVYDASATPGEITVSLAQWFIDSHQGALLIGELYRIDHASDTVYTGSEEIEPGKMAVLRFNLPAGATSLALDGGEIGGRFVRTADGLVDTQPLPPGGTQILMRYLLPLSGDQIELAHSVPYPTDRLNVLVVDGPEVTTDLQSLGPQTVSEQQWNSFERVDLPADESISLRLANLSAAAAAVAPAPAPARPNASTAVVSFNPGLLIAVGVAALLAALAVLGAYLLLRPAAAAEQPALAAPATVLDPAAERQRLAAAIAQLDDLYAAGEIGADSYQRTRAAQKRSLLLAAAGARSETDPSAEDAGEAGGDQASGERAEP
jgi:mono/diheme cytochrome c family protein